MLQCQCPGCLLDAKHPKRAPLICDRHSELDTRQGKFSVILLWAMLSYMAHRLHAKAVRDWHAGKKLTEAEAGESMLISTIYDAMLKKGWLKRFRDWLHGQIQTQLGFPIENLVTLQKEFDWVDDIYPKSALKPQVHVLVTYLRMLEAFEGPDRPAWIQENKPEVVAVGRVGLSYVDRWTEKLRAVQISSGLWVIAVDESWAGGPPPRFLPHDLNRSIEEETSNAGPEGAHQ